jgi:hypothetical protein
MNIKNAMCSLKELTSEQIDILRNAMPKGKYDFFQTENMIGATPSGSWGTWHVASEKRNIISYTEMMQLLGKTMKEFTKSDLIKLQKTKTLVVKVRMGQHKLVTKEGLIGTLSCAVHEKYNEQLITRSGTSGLDIIAVYEASTIRCFEAYLDGESLTLIWERTEQKPAQKEMEVLQAKMNELQEQMKVVQAKL